MGLGAHESSDLKPLTPEEYLFFRNYIMREAGIDLGENKSALVMGRLSKRLRALRLFEWKMYIRYLKDLGNDEERKLVVNLLTTNKTEFMREAHHFQFLVEKYLPSLVQQMGDEKRPIYFWSAACSKGHEPYTLAMVLEDYKARNFVNFDYRILATDINTDVLEFAEAAVYESMEVKPALPAHFIELFFFKGLGSREGSYRVKDQIRSKVKFRPFNLISDEVIPLLFDVIFLRNVLIYFNQSTLQHVVEKIHRHLLPGGALFVGLSESIGDRRDLFESLGYSTYRKWP